MANEYLKRTPTSTGNRKTFTISFWKKHSKDGGSTLDFSAVGNTVNENNNRSILYWSNVNSFDYYHNVAGVVKHRRVEPSDNNHRDFSSWYHVLVSTDTTKNESRIYLNGIEINYNTDGTVDTINYETWYNSPYLHAIGAQFGETFHNKTNYFDWFLVDGQALTPEVFGFYKDGNGYISAGSTQATDFRNGQWVPRKPNSIINEINANGGFGVNGFYLPMNDSSNFGADFHCKPNSIIKLKGEDLPQPRNGAPETTDAYVSQLRADPYAANLVLAVPGISTATGPNLVTNGNFDSNIGGWVADSGATLSHSSGSLRITVSSTAGARQSFAVESGKRYTLSFRVRTDGTNFANFAVDVGGTINYVGNESSTNWVTYSKSFVANSSTAELRPYKALGGWAEFDDIVFKQEDAPRDYSADIKGSGTNKTLTASGNAGVGYEIPSYYGSAMSFDGTDDYFSTPNVSDFQFGTGDFTIEAWAYSFSGTWSLIMAQGTTGDAGRTLFGVSNTGQLVIQTGDQSIASSAGVVTSEQWNHCAVVRENGVGTLYLNGVAVGINTVYTNSIQNTTLYVGKDVGWTNTSAKMYLQDLRVYKGVAKYKGGFDVPKPYTPVGIESFRAVPDTCQNNFATLNPLDSTLPSSNGNLSISQSSGGWHALLSTHYVSSGKWYAEMRIDTLGWIFFGVDQTRLETDTKHIGGQAGTKGIGLVYNTGSRGDITYNGANSVYTPANTPGASATAANGDIISIQLDLDNNNIKFYLNNSLQYNLDNLLESGADYAFGVGAYSSVAATVNFGQNPTFSGNTTAGTYTDSNGKGLFKYQPPSGFLALCEDNLPTPTIKDPGEYFKTVLYTGDDNNGHSITGVGFTPDFIWIKSRTVGTRNHRLQDSVRGFTNVLSSDLTIAEYGTGDVSSTSNDGFSLLSRDNQNVSGEPYVAWCWKAGGEAVTNTDGSIVSRVSANQTAGFSIVSYTGTDSAGTVGHGLGKKPKMVIVKRRDATTNWPVWFDGISNNTDQVLQLNLTSATATASTFFNSSDTTTTTFPVGSGGGQTNTSNMIAYCWAEIEGFSKFGSYIGNASADGPFVYCGFKPAWILVKRTDAIEQWIILDSSRSSTNPVNLYLVAQAPDAEAGTGSSLSVDFLSNGFKMRQTGAAINASGGTYIFAAFAESPFKYANSK